MAKTQTIVLVEDDKFLSRALTDKLTRAGYGVITAYDGEEGLNKVAQSKPDLILLDLVMPNMNGFQFLEELKNRNGKPPKVVVLSNLGQQEDIDKAKELGAVDYLVKADFSLKEVLAKIENVIS